MVKAPLIEQVRIEKIKEDQTQKEEPTKPNLQELLSNMEDHVYQPPLIERPAIETLLDQTLQEVEAHKHAVEENPSIDDLLTKVESHAF